MSLTDAGRIPIATFRVQLQTKFTFADAEAQIDYLRRLGISDLYFSPIFMASPGSTHGYDVNDFGVISPELGGEEAFNRVTDRLRAEGLGLLVDMVPNHMGIAGPRNAWWRDVLESGPHSVYAPFFDIQWNASGERGARVLVPMLEDHYGKVLEEGKIAVVFDQGFFLKYRDVKLPIQPNSYARILRELAKDPTLPTNDRREASDLAAAFAGLPRVEAAEDLARAKARTAELRRMQENLVAWVASHSFLRATLDETLRTLNGTIGEAESFSELHALIEEQHYRLARWKAGMHEINYRRFFAIDSLVGLRAEEPEVFAESHALIARFLREGRVTGLRIDHIDGLRLPAEYLARLQRLERPIPERPLYLLVEKILAAPKETLPENWPVHGTSGYEFISQLAGLLVDGGTEDRMIATYRKFTDDQDSYSDTVYAKKRLILDELFANAVSNLGSSLATIMAGVRRWQDMTSSELVIAVREILAALPVYRTYRATDAAVSTAERSVLEYACSRAVARNPRLDPQPLEFVRDLLAGDYPSGNVAPQLRRQLLNWVLTFQQYSGAVMAKSVEDTAFYTYCPLIALNEVGGNPGVFSTTLAEFHAVNRQRLRQDPQTMLTTSTHDTKLSEDVRARLYGLSEIAERWDRWVDRWHALNARHRTAIEQHSAPDRLDEYRFYQVLLGAWPLDLRDVNEEFRQRLRSHFRKAVDEAKRHTSPLQPNELYLLACDRFVDAVTNPDRAPEFLADFAPCAQTVARIGLVNSLTQVALKCTVPGMPDFYQGNEIWDFSLVDPDNRRDVDYERRHEILRSLEARSWTELLEHWRDGGIKMRVMQSLLRYRNEHPAVFQRGTYEPLQAHGAFADHVVAFQREHGGHSIVVVVPRLAVKIGCPPVGVVWDNTELPLPEAKGQPWRDLFTGKTYATTGALKVSELFSELPLAVLESVAGSGAASAHS